MRAGSAASAGPVRLVITSMAIGGEAVGRDGTGKVVFVEGGLPGEEVDALVYDERGSYARASLVDVLLASPDRTEPPCPHVSRGCGGCGWQHILPDAQVGLKVALVTEALQRFGGLSQPDVLRGPALPATRYRTSLRVAIAIGPDGKPGFRRRRSHEVVEVDSCLVAHPLLEELLATGRFGAATEAVLRCSARTGERLCVLGPTAEGADFGGVPEVVVVGRDQLGRGVRAAFHEEVAGHRFRVSADSFFQARPDGGDALVGLVAEALDAAPDGPLVDAYGGVGLFAAALGGDRRVTVVESSAPAAEDCRVNVPAATVARVGVEKWQPTRASIVVADPPRSGLGRRAVEVLGGTGATHLALVSCDAASLGRDAKLLAGQGFELRRTTVVDMFPGTPHIETVSAFVR